MEDELFNSQAMHRLAKVGRQPPQPGDVADTLAQCQMAIKTAAENEKFCVLLRIAPQLLKTVQSDLAQRDFAVYVYSHELLGVHW